VCPWGKNFFILAPFDRKIKNAALHMARDYDASRASLVAGTTCPDVFSTGQDGLKKKQEQGLVSAPERTR
jgi:hypothetical protein